jgi:hypothetical protein
MAIFFKCKACGKEHQSPLNVGDKLSFENLNIQGSTFYCDNHYKSCSYDKNELYWKDEILA